MNKPFKIPWAYLLAISLTGLGIGFLVGLSASPVVNALIGGIVSLAAGVVSALCGVRLEKSEAKDSPGNENPNPAIVPQDINRRASIRAGRSCQPSCLGPNRSLLVHRNNASAATVAKRRL